MPACRPSYSRAEEEGRRGGQLPRTPAAAAICLPAAPTAPILPCEGRREKRRRFSHALGTVAVTACRGPGLPLPPLFPCSGTKGRRRGDSPHAGHRSRARQLPGWATVVEEEGRREECEGNKGEGGRRRRERERRSGR